MTDDQRIRIGVQPCSVPRCAVCGAWITGYHDCVTPMQRTSVQTPGSFVLTPWGTWEWRPW